MSFGEMLGRLCMKRKALLLTKKQGRFGLNLFFESLPVHTDQKLGVIPGTSHTLQ
jgi:hypothetical protein